MANRSTHTGTDTSSGCDVQLPAGVASAIAGVCEKTLGRMADRGKLTVTRTTGGHRRYRKSEIEALASGDVT